MPYGNEGDLACARRCADQGVEWTVRFILAEGTVAGCGMDEAPIAVASLEELAETPWAMAPALSHAEIPTRAARPET